MMPRNGRVRKGLRRRCRHFAAYGTLPAATELVDRLLFRVPGFHGRQLETRRLLGMAAGHPEYPYPAAGRGARWLAVARNELWPRREYEEIVDKYGIGGPW
jgi:hypothetical protein